MSGAPAEPLVTIGMPVYNGEKYLRQALSSLLAQDYPHFELIISDNASRDRTGEICCEFQKADPRIRYMRQTENQGSPWNFAFVVQQARGEYFMWAAHDDLWAPSYVRKCLAKLESHPDAVLCCTEIDFIDATGLPLYESTSNSHRNIETGGMTPAQRIHELIVRWGWFAIFGLMRLEDTKKLSLGLSVYGGDVIFLLELLLIGNFVKVHETLFSYRIVKQKSAVDYQTDFNSETNPVETTRTPLSDLASQLLQTVYRSGLSDKEKLGVFADFIFTLTCAHPSWRQEITLELAGAGASLSDSRFAALLSIALSRAIPIKSVKQNPLLERICLASAGGPDLLEVAENLRGRPYRTTPTSHDETHRRAVQLFGEGRFEEASNLFQEALDQRESSDRWLDWATARLACNHVDDAGRGLGRALALDADNHQAALKLGILLSSLGRHTEAVPYLEQCLSGIEEPERSQAQQLLQYCRTNLAVPITR